jgi:hypothetical protein
MNRGRLPTDRCRPLTGNRLERMSGRTICRNTPSHIMSPTRDQPESSTEVSLGVRGHTPTLQRAHAPPTDYSDPTHHQTRRLDTGPRDK